MMEAEILTTVRFGVPFGREAYKKGSFVQDILWHCCSQLFPFTVTTQVSWFDLLARPLCSSSVAHLAHKMPPPVTLYVVASLKQCILPAPCAEPVVLSFNMWTLTLVLQSDFFPMMLLGLLNKKALLTPPLCSLSSTRCVVLQHYPIAVCFSRVSWSSVGNLENRVVIFMFGYVS